MDSVLAAASTTMTSVNRTYLNSSTTMIVIPAYPHLGNIFHFSFVAATSAFLAVTHADREQYLQQPVSTGGENTAQYPRHVSFVFRGHIPWRLGKWQTWVMQAMTRRLQMVGMQSDIYALGQNDVDDQKKEKPASVSPAFCAQRAIIMGPRYTVNLWPFPTGVQVRYIDITNKHILIHNHENDIKPKSASAFASSSSTTIASTLVLEQRKSDMLILTPTSSAVKFSAQALSPQPNSPVESLAFRVASYNHANLSTYIPRVLVHGIYSAPTETWADLPPLVLGYARRNTEAVRDPAPGHYVTGGPIRRLSDADEAWLISMLGNETRQAGMEFRVIETTRNMPMQEQVSIFHGTGVVVGLHGANLVNAMFMPPFSALVEISPINMPCYNGGMNSGLVAWRVITNRVASPEESACPPWHVRCKTDRLERRVLVDEQDVRARVEYAVRQAIAHVRILRQRFGKYEAVPIRLKQDAATYFIAWDK